MTDKNWQDDPELESFREALKRVNIEFQQVLPDVLRILAPVGEALKEASRELVKLAFKKPENPFGPKESQK